MYNFGRAVALVAALGWSAVPASPAQQPGMPGHEPGKMEQGMPGMQGMMQEMQGMMHEMMGIHAYGPSALLDRRADLALTADQVRKLEALANEVETAKAHAKAEHETRHARIVEQFKLAKPDPMKVKVAGQEVMQDMAAAHGISLSAAARAKGLLTETQRGKVDAWVAEQGHAKH